MTRASETSQPGTQARSSGRSEPSSEPVAWRIRRKKEDAGFGRPQVFLTDDASEGDLKQWRRNGYEVTPLYAPSSLPAGEQELREKVEIADEWLSLVEGLPLEAAGSILRWAPICQTEIEAIRAILSALQARE